MAWSERFPFSQPPALDEIEEFVESDAWGDLNAYIQSAYAVSPSLEYSKCAMQRGWNVKYKKGGRSLCTLYPMDGSFIVLVVIGRREMPEAEQMLPFCSPYVQELYKKTPFSAGGKWLMIRVSQPGILEDVKKLIGTRYKP